MSCKHCGNQTSEKASSCDRCGKKKFSKSGNVKKIVLFVFLAIAVILTGCGDTGDTVPVHTHSWKAATCTAPETCTGCGDTRGEALGHLWQEATYDSPKTCDSCGVTEGRPQHPLDGQSVEIGDRVYFGEYGYEQIEWKVIDKKDNKRLLISEYGLDCVEYDNQDSSDDSPEAVSWSDCSLRRWLNKNFYNEAFTDQEAGAILSVSDDGISDKVFILSYSQLEEYFPAQSGRICEPTAYSIENGSYSNPYNKNGGWWWIRTNESVNKVSSVNSDGSIDHNTRINSRNSTVRVCIWIEVPLLSPTAAENWVVSTGTCGADLTWTLDGEGTLTISGSGAMKDYFLNAPPWDSQEESIQSVVVEGGVTRIGDCAFLGCTNLSSITIPDSITNIGAFVFDAFGSCEKLERVNITDIAAWCNIEIEGYGSNPLRYASNGLYLNGEPVTSVVLPNSVTTIPDHAFRNCTKLISITIPEGVTKIGQDAFRGCTSLTGIWVNDGNSIYSSDDHGVLFNKNKNQLMQVPEAIAGAYSIPASVISIPDNAFRNCTKLTSITIPKNVARIGENAFDGCENLNRVDITDVAAWCNIYFEDPWSNPLRYASNGLYLNGEPVTSVVLPNSVTTIPDHAFRNCTKLTSITLPNSVTSVPDYAFANCTSLPDITIPDSVTRIGQGAFMNCDNLNRVDITDIVAWCNIDFESFDSNPVYYASGGLYLNGEPITAVVLPDGITSIPDSAFRNCTKLTSITIPNSVTNIGDSAFAGCTQLTGITIPDSVISIPDNAFDGCTNLRSITIPASVTNIGFCATASCRRLTTVYYGGTKAQREGILIDDCNWALEDARWRYECTEAN